MTSFILNDRIIHTDKPTASLLLDFIRYDQRMTGTKIGCREGDCGACTVLIGDNVDSRMEYQQVTSCLTPLGNVQGKHVVSVEGLNMDELSPVQQFMVDESGTQCGFCTVGFVVSLTAYCLSNKEANNTDSIAAIDGNICRCTGYKSIERAANGLTRSLKEKDPQNAMIWLVDHKFIPDYFKDIPDQLKNLQVVDPEETSRSTKRILIGGGTDLYVQRHLELVEHDAVLVAHSEDMRYIEVKDGVCLIGGGTTVSQVLKSDDLNAIFPRLSEHIKLVSSTPIRNISTIAGNFVNASPIGDFTAFFLALNSSITLTDDHQQRTIFLKDFYKGYKQLDKEVDEIITEISFPIPSLNSHFNLEKVSKRIHLDIASVNTAAQITVSDGTIEEVHISAGGIGPIPTYLSRTCDFLRKRALDPETVRMANDILQDEISPIGDVRGSAAYKRLLLRQLFFAHFIKLFPERISLKDLL